MPEDDRRGGDPLTIEGRPCVRFRLPDPETSGFVVVATIAGRYRVEDLFAAGRLSALLEATDERTGLPVLIKTLRSDAIPLPADLPGCLPVLEGEVRRLRHELQTERRLLVRLRNAGVVAVPHPNDYAYDINPALAAEGLDPRLAEAEPFLVLRLIDGVTLEEMLARGFPKVMTERDALTTLRPVVAVLAKLHEPWIGPNGRHWHCVYQDLKPANILIDRSGRPTLLDFGGCQVVVDGVPVLEGGYTRGYAPPECEGPPRVLLPCADVWTIGSTLHHMLTGIDPRERLARGRGLHVDDLPRRLSPPVRDLMAQLLAPRPSDRLADAGAVLRRIDALLEP